MATVLTMLLVAVALDVLYTWLSPLGARAGSALREALGCIGLASVSIAVLRAGAAVAALTVYLSIMLTGSRAVVIDACEGYLPMHDDTHFIMDKTELDMIHRLPDRLPDNAIVIGDPVAEAGYIPILTGMRSVWVSPSQAADDQDGIHLRENFNRIHTDPHVCELLRQHGIYYFYANKDIVFNGNRLSKFRPGLYEIDTSNGFTLVGSSGSASPWRIDVYG